MAKAAKAAGSPLELTQFITQLVVDTFDALQQAARLQEERCAELARAACLDSEDFAALAVSESDLEREAASLFPGAGPDKVHHVYPGAPYRPELQAGDVEQPPFRLRAGVELLHADYAPATAGKSFVLTESGAHKILGALRAQLASRRMSILKRVIARGVPRVNVASARINAKVALSVEGRHNRDDEARLLVRASDDHTAHPKNVDTLSEIEITFKTTL